jgi:hypothetical protein
LRVSADAAAPHDRQNGGKTRVFPGTEEKSGERRTGCWRGLDSKFQFRVKTTGEEAVKILS